MTVTIENNKIIYGEIKSIYIEEFGSNRYEVCLIGYNNFIEKEYLDGEPIIKITEDEDEK